MHSIAHLQILESQLKIKQTQVEELESQSKHIKDIDPEKEPVLQAKRTMVEERFRKVLAPLQARRSALEKVKRTQQFLRDVEDERIWIEEKMPQAKSEDYGNSLLSVQMLVKKNRSLQNEMDSHEPRINSVCDTGRELIDEGHPLSDEFQHHIDDPLFSRREVPALYLCRITSVSAKIVVHRDEHKLGIKNK